jgi:hypothetical protein
MSLLSTKLSLESDFNSNWSYTPVAWPNIDLGTSDLDEWVSFNVMNGESSQASMGGDTNTHRFFGVVIVQIFVRPSTGSKRAFELADLASSLLRSKTIGAVVLRSPDIQLVGLDNGWYQVNVKCSFYTDEIL